MTNKLNVGSVIVVDWPGEGPVEFQVSDIRPDKDGVLCAIFGKGGVVGAEAVKDFCMNQNGTWEISKK